MEPTNQAKKVLSRNEILALPDIQVKEIIAPENIPAWGGITFYIKQLTRGQQDQYLKRQYGDTRMKQEAKGKKASSQEITSINIYGHDSWLVVMGAVNSDGTPMFNQSDIELLNAKSGEAIGWLAFEIVKFSGMDRESKIAKGETTEEDEIENEVKN